MDLTLIVGVLRGMARLLPSRQRQHLMDSLRIARSTLSTITAGLFLLLVTALLTVDGAPENTFKLVSTGQSFVQTTDITILQTLTKIACSSICLAQLCPGFCFNPGTKVCLVFVGPATWVPLTLVTGTRLYWIGGVMPTTTTTTTTTTTMATTTAPVPQPGFTYVYYSTQLNYVDAQAACTSMGATLAAPMTPERWEVFKNTVGPHTFNEQVRLWADDLEVEGDFRWGPNNLPVDMTTNWLPGKPFGGNYFFSNYDCLFANENGFVDNICRPIIPYDGKFAYACEVPVPDCHTSSSSTCFIP